MDPSYRQTGRGFGILVVPAASLPQAPDRFCAGARPVLGADTKEAERGAEKTDATTFQAETAQPWAPTVPSFDQAMSQSLMDLRMAVDGLVKPASVEDIGCLSLALAGLSTL